eukprot:3699569-Pyramimonas_sp.AAC.1
MPSGDDTRLDVLPFLVNPANLSIAIAGRPGIPFRKYGLKAQVVKDPPFELVYSIKTTHPNRRC